MASIDANACLGVKDSKSGSALGSFGEKKVNKAGRVVVGFLLENSLCAAATFFQKRRKKYATWHHPYHKDGSGGRCGYQLNHWL